MYEVSKSDWKLFREKIGGWQERYMERLVEKYIKFLSSDKAASEKFWELEKRILNDKKHVGVTAVMSRSRFLDNIFSLLYEKAIVYEDLSDFSDELKNHVHNILKYN